jgi:protein arginine kinase activator
MRCEQCGKAEATVKITRLENGQPPYQMVLCQSCAAEVSPHQKKLLEKQSNYDILLQKLLKHQQEQSGAAPVTSGGGLAEVDDDEETLVCPSCGLDFQRYRATLMLGCPDCYDAFADQLEEDLQRFHRTTRHLGGEAERPSELAELQERIHVAKAELKSALEYEDYERAAFLRDEIASAEERMKAMRETEAEKPTQS